MMKRIALAVAALAAAAASLTAGSAVATPADPTPSPAQVKQFQGEPPAAKGARIQDAPKCNNIGNGLLCIRVDRYLYSHDVTVWYDKWSGPAVRIGLGYRGVNNDYHPDNGEFWISAGQLKGFTWHWNHAYWGDGCFNGYIWQNGAIRFWTGEACG